MPFGLTNAPADFQKFINHILCPFLNSYASAYLDDVLIYSKSYEDHVRHIFSVLVALGEAELLLKPEKCQFHQLEVSYMGMVMGRKGINIDNNKVKAIRE